MDLRHIDAIDGCFGALINIDQPIYASGRWFSAGMRLAGNVERVDRS